MNENRYAGNREQLEMLALELSEVKDTLQEMSRQLRRIERRANVVLPPPEKEKKRGRSRIDEKAVRETIDRLTESARKGERIEAALRRMTVKNELAVIASKLGMTNARLPPKDELVRSLAARIRQSAMVRDGFAKAVGEHRPAAG